MPENNMAFVEKAVKLLDAKKAEDIVVLDLRELTSIGDFFIIASGNNITLVKSLAEELEEQMAKDGLRPRRIEGANSSMWILMDYVDVVVHLFYNETRDFYCLERLWADAPKLDLKGLINK
ncbi:MAG: ribosome silencing factor [Oscillospiraceae bacterium]|nr:ribosome silencing factor [Oscillospiraceae bacterium]